MSKDSGRHEKYFAHAALVVVIRVFMVYVFSIDGRSDIEPRLWHRIISTHVSRSPQRERCPVS